jgi:hypothetical protein
MYTNRAKLYKKELEDVFYENLKNIEWDAADDFTKYDLIDQREELILIKGTECLDIDSFLSERTEYNNRIKYAFCSIYISYKCLKQHGISGETIFLGGLKSYANTDLFDRIAEELGDMYFSTFFHFETGNLVDIKSTKSWFSFKLTKDGKDYGNFKIKKP